MSLTSHSPARTGTRPSLCIKPALVASPAAQAHSGRNIRAQALAKGLLRDITDVARDVGFIFDVAITPRAWEYVVRWPQGGENTEVGRLHDVVSRAYRGLDATGFRVGATLSMTLSKNPGHSRPTPADGSPLLVVVHLGDRGEKVVTLRLRDEL
ncbi:MAG: hypothetical protein GX542_13155 [Rhodococcus sp.]|nr:hypothetical protein [Rhodococcus sp. (in: high G+C Gram-positive bacteria)]